MAKQTDTGVYQLKNGNWAYRFTLTKDGHRTDIRKSKDEQGHPLKTKRDAIKARRAAIVLEQEKTNRRIIERKTVNEVWKEYCEKGREGKAYRTIQKQDSVWKNHIHNRFGHRCVSEISVAEVNDYLTELYYTDGLAYRYVESFLKIFYLIFGQAYSRDYLEVDIYNKLCVNKSTRIKMPKMKVDDDTENVATFSREQLALLDDYFEGTNAETAYLLGRLCGLRINESFGLKWDNVDLENGTIYIDRQQQYQDGLIKLVPVKTRNGKRTIYLSERMRAHLAQKWEKEQEYRRTHKAVREQKQRFIEDLDGSRISSVDLVNCLPDGTIQTVNSFKYPSREIKAKLGIQFKYHYLRHTYGTMMAEMNTPSHLLCNQMGHGNIRITQRYYLGVSPTGIEALHKNLEHL